MVADTKVLVEFDALQSLRLRLKTCERSAAKFEEQNRLLRRRLHEHTQLAGSLIVGEFLAIVVLVCLLFVS